MINMKDKTMIVRTEKDYISPVMDVRALEVEQAILNSSCDIESLGERLEDQEW